jgi:long-chain acyl-CoA synthetase
MRTINRLFADSVDKFGSNTFLLEKQSGKYTSLTYEETARQVKKFAAGLISLGIHKGDRIALLSEGCSNWVISELGILYAGAVNVPLSVKLIDADEVKFRLVHSGARMIIVSTRQLKKIDRLKNELPQLERFIVFDDNHEKQHPKDISFKQVMNLGIDFLETSYAVYEKRIESVEEDDYATISYTSGTTSDPKGVILSHRNYTANVEQSLSLFDVPSYYTTLLILPWDHAFAHTVGIYPLIKGGGSIASVELGNSTLETLKNIPVNIREIKPHFILSVPALAKNFKKNIEKAIRDKGKEKIFNKALAVAYKYNGNGWDKGMASRKLLKPVYTIYDKLIFSKIRKNFGGRLKFFVGGGALLDIEIQRFFSAIGIPMYQGYGLSEASPVISSNTIKHHKMGSSGKLVTNMELKICDEEGNELPVGQKGEIVIKGENVMKGYWNNEKATSDTIRDGWLYTGDLGYLDADGFLYVLGRFKSLLIADDGEKYSPESIEEAIMEFSPFVEQCMLFNNQNPYTVALFVINREAINRWFQKYPLDGKLVEKEVLDLLNKELDQFRPGGRFENMFPQRWLPSSFAIVREGFTEENKMMNSTMKIVRPKITEFYNERIQAMYTSEGKNIHNHQNIEVIQKIFG